jgi:hypothetical protein
MNSHRIISARSRRSTRRQSALERSGEFLERDTEASQAEMLRLMRQTYFADVDELEKSGQVKLPE